VDVVVAASDVDDDHAGARRSAGVDGSQQLDTGEYDVGRGTEHHRGEVVARAQVLAADHVRENTSRIATRADSGARTPIVEHVVSEDERCAGRVQLGCNLD